MLKIDIISGFLGSGKTTFIKRLLETKLKNEKVVLIENEYGEVSIDSNLLDDTGVEIKELSQGCICCSLVGDFSKSLNEVISKYNPDRVLIEPSGVGKLSDIIKAVQSSGLENYINSLVCMVDAKKAKMYDKNFGEFFVDQIKNAQTVILSRMDISKEETAQTALEIIRKHNDKCVVISTPISELSDEDLLKAYEGFDVNLLADIEIDEHEHHHHEDEECCCGHHHDEHEHHHHEDEECCCGH
ncbi:MAG: GTP-binding protein, partial [Anaeroplasma sp.]